MKSKTILFLFFVITSIPLVFYAQAKIDSLTYYKNSVTHPQAKKELDKAYTYFVEQSVLHESQNNTLAQAYDLIYISFVQLELGFLYDSEESAVKALSIIDIINTEEADSYKITLYNQLGIVYNKLMDYKSSLAYYEKALQLEVREEQTSILFNNIGNTYREMELYEKAFSYYRKAKELCDKNGDKKQLARVLDNLGFAQLKINDNQALSNLKKALQLRRADNDTFGMITSLLHIAEFHDKKNNKDLASKNVMEALEISEATKNSSYIVRALETKFAVSEYPDVKNYKKLTDSITKATHQARNNYAAKKYSLEKQLALTKEKELETLKYKQQSIIYLLLGLIITILSIGTYFFLKSKHRKNTIVQIYKTETRISKTVHDEIANDIFLVMHKLEQTDVTKDHILEDLDTIYGKTRDISNANSGINTKDNFTETLHYLLLSYKTPQLEIITKGMRKISWKSISEDKKTALFRVLQELMTNMKKHSNATIVVVNFESAHKKLVVSYKDNGIGTTAKKGNGLLNAENRINTVSGTINFESKARKGFTAIISL